MNTPMNSPNLTSATHPPALSARVLLLGWNAPRRPESRNRSLTAPTDTSTTQNGATAAKPTVCRRLDFTEAGESQTAPHSS